MGAPLNIDWQQILLHLFNFIVLAFGLYLLLYKPVKAFMGKRTEHYKAMDEEAEKHLQNAKQTEAEYNERLQKAEEKADEIKSEALKKADDIAKARVNEAELQKQQIIADAKKAALSEKSKMLNEANGEIEKMVQQAIDNLTVKADSDPFDDFLNTDSKE